MTASPRLLNMAKCVPGIFFQLAMSENSGTHMIVPVDWSILSFDPREKRNYEYFYT